VTPDQTYIEILKRIILLEERLSITMEKLSNLIDTMDENYRSIVRKYEGDERTPSIPSRIISLEEFNRSLRWGLGVLYTAVVGVVVKLLIDEVKR